MFELNVNLRVRITVEQVVRLSKVLALLATWLM
jgi:hypothetical protein